MVGVSKAETEHVTEKMVRKLPIGAEPCADGVHFRVWAPGHFKVEVVFEAPENGEPSASGRGTLAEPLVLAAEADGYFVGLAASAKPGDLYRFRLDDVDALYADPASRFQPLGPMGPSQIVDSAAFKWTDESWPGAQLKGQVVYEMHVGTFTPEGTWSAATEKLSLLAELGITLIELMPIAEFSGDFGWSYDGVNLFAPTQNYGTPDEFLRFVDTAHRLRIGVLLDVVFNHFGAVGNYLPQFSQYYTTERYSNEWGAAINFDGDHSKPVREFFLANAQYWISEFHLDGFRIDATQQFFDESPQHILTEITQAARTAAGPRDVIVLAENEPQHAAKYLGDLPGHHGMDGVWNDDFHRAATVRATGRHDGYFNDYRGRASEFASLLKWGYLYQGQRFAWQEKRRGTPTFGLPAWQFVNYLQNHDQIANTGLGLRLHQLTSPGRYRALTALLLLGPATPMLFQGQEFAASSPFKYFWQTPSGLQARIAKGRKEFMSQFRTLATPEAQASLPEPAAPETFKQSKLDHSEREKHVEAWRLHRDLIALRKDDPVLSRQDNTNLFANTLNDDALVVRLLDRDGEDRLIVVNLGQDLHFEPAPEPLLAPPENATWQTLWSSEDPKYGGLGTPQLDTDDGWLIPGEAVVVLRPAFENR